MEGIRGENMKRPIKVKKKSNVKKMILPIMAFNGSGVGQALLFMSAPIVCICSSLFPYWSRLGLLNSFACMKQILDTGLWILVGAKRKSRL